MRKKCFTVLIVSLILSVSLQAIAAESLVGEWHGPAQVSGVPFSLSATLNANKDGTFSISVTGFRAVGYYIVDDSIISVMPTKFDGILAYLLVPPENIGIVSFPYILRDGELSIRGDAMGLSGTMSLSRR